MNANSKISQAPGKVEQLCQTWRVPREVGQDIVKLALFDIILYVGMLLLFSEWGVGLISSR